MRVEDVNGSGLTDAGDRVTYSFTVTNTGNVPVSRVQVDDPLLSTAGVLVSCPAGVLAPGESRTCDATSAYTITAADVAAGATANRATASGTDPDGDTVTSPPDTTTTPTTLPQPRLVIDKVAAAPVDANGSGITDAGDAIRYSFTVTNAGNVPVDAVRVHDARLAADGIVTTCAPTALAPGESAACTTSASYRVSAADVASGSVANTATATGTDPDRTPVTSGPDTTVDPDHPPAALADGVEDGGRVRGP